MASSEHYQRQTPRSKSKDIRDPSSVDSSPNGSKLAARRLPSEGLRRRSSSQRPTRKRLGGSTRSSSKNNSKLLVDSTTLKGALFDDSTVEPLQLILDPSGTEIECQATRFSKRNQQQEPAPPVTSDIHMIAQSCHEPSSSSSSPTTKIKSRTTASRRTSRQAPRVRTTSAAQRLAQSSLPRNQRRTIRTVKPSSSAGSDMLTPQQALLHESCVF